MDKKDFKICRFIDISACKKVFHTGRYTDFGTFLLRSPEYYRNIEDKVKQDMKEGSIRHKNEKGQDCTSERSYLISCWTKLDGDIPSEQEWRIFDDSHVMALISSPKTGDSHLLFHHYLIGACP